MVGPVSSGNFQINYELLASQLLTSKDTLAPAALTSKIPIIEFARVVQETIDKLKQQLGVDAEKDNSLSSIFHQAVVNRALFLRLLIQQCIAAIQLQKNLVTLRNQQVNEVNAQIDLYNVDVPAVFTVPPADILAVQDLYAAMLDFVNPQSFNYLNQSLLNSALSDYRTITGDKITTIRTAFEAFANDGDGAKLGNALGTFFLTNFPALVVPLNLDAMVTAWGNFADDTKIDYQNMTVLDAFTKNYAPFLYPGYTPPVVATPITEQGETLTLNQAIADYNNSVVDAFALSLAFAQYEAYRAGSLSTPINALNTYINNLSPTPTDLDNLTFVLATHHRFIQGAPNVFTAIATYQAIVSPTPADLATLKGELTNYLNYLNTGPVTDLNRNAAVDTLNSYLTIYNGLINDNNATVDTINFARQQLGLPLLELQDLVTLRSYLPPAPVVIDGSVLLDDREVYERVTLFTRITVNDQSIQEALDKQFNQAMIFFGFMGNYVSGTDTNIKFSQFIYKGISLLNPSGIDPVTTPQTASSNPSPGVGYATTALDLSSPFVEAVVSAALMEAFFKNAQIPDKPEIMQAIKVATLQLIHDHSFIAGGSTIAFLADALPSLSLLPYLGMDEAAVSIVFAVEYAKEVRNLFLSDVPKNLILQILEGSEAFGNISPDKLAELAGGISASIAASVGTVSLVIIAEALGTPGLTAQLLSLLPGVQALNDNVLSPPIFADFVGNGLSASLVGNLLIGSGLDASATARVLAQALGEGSSSPDDFYNSLQKALIEAGVAPGQAQSLALAATQLILQQGTGALTQSELDKVLLDGVIDQQALAKALGSEALAAAVVDRLNQDNLIANSVLKANILEDFRFTNELTNALIRANILGDGVIREQIQRDEITQEAIRRDTLLRDIRDAVRSELIAQGEDIQAADVKAQAAMDALREDFDLNNRLEIAFVNQEVLKNSIEKALIIKGLREDEAILRAEIIADSLAQDRENYASRNSLRAAIRDILVNQFNTERGQASLIAAGLDLGIPAPEAVALYNIGRAPYTLYEIVMALETRISALLGGRLSAELTDKLIDRFKTIVIEDDNSLNRVIDRSITQVVNLQNEELVQALSSQIRDIVKPNVEIFAFIDKIKDPGNALVFSVWSGLMYGQNQSRDYKRDLDIMI